MEDDEFDLTGITSPLKQAINLSKTIGDSRFATMISPVISAQVDLFELYTKYKSRVGILETEVEKYELQVEAGKQRIKNLERHIEALNESDPASDVQDGKPVPDGLQADSAVPGQQRNPATDSVPTEPELEPDLSQEHINLLQVLAKWPSKRTSHGVVAGILGSSEGKVAALYAELQERQMVLPGRNFRGRSGTFIQITPGGLKHLNHLGLLD